MKFEIQTENDYSIMTLKSDRLDTKVAPELKSQFIVLANTSESGHLILDLGAVSFADSSGLGALLLAQRLYRDLDRNLVLCNVPERIKKLLSISQLDNAFTIAADINDGITLASEPES
ncbi:STAS domain-containing protein [Balneolaceae bacterium ANBcel3]|nr:STAS domain-containing protein [Balneolaceae bacterium ANBcel3]